MTFTTTASSRQSLLDIAIEHCGQFEAAFDIAVKNGLNLTDDLTAGQEIELVEPTDKSVAAFFAVQENKPATAVTQNEIIDILDISEGIDFWGIEFDFIVQ